MSGYNRRAEPNIVDMSRSGIKKEDWKKVMSGAVVPPDWKKTRKVIPTKYSDAPSAIRPLWVFEWNNNKPEAISTWGLQFGHTLVTEKDGYWPEGIPPDAKGNFVRGDLILMKVLVEDHLERRRDEIKRGRIGHTVKTQQFQNQLKQIGADVSEQEITDALGF